MKYLVNIFKDAKEYGSILKIEEVNFNKLTNALSNFKLTNDLNRFKYQNEIKLCESIINQSITLSQKYDITITNPPYMGNKGMDSKLNNYLKINFKNTKKDLSTVFMERSFNFTKEIGFISMINIPVWMFISSYETLREEIINRKLFINMLHLGRGIFGSDFGTTAFVIRNKYISNYNSTFKQLYKDSGAVDSISKKEKMFFNDKNMYLFKPNNFDKIPGMPIVYWVSDEILNVFSNFPKFSSYIDAKKGMFTGKNDLFLKYWYEIPFFKLFKTFKPYSKGGEFRRWYGNNLFVINWGIDGRDVKNFKGSGGVDEKIFFKKCCTWNLITSSKTSFRAILIDDFVIGDAGPAFYPNDDLFLYSLGCLNSKVGDFLLNMLNPTINCSPGVIKKFPFLIKNDEEINELVNENIYLTKEDWDSYELSWDFKIHPLLSFNSNLIHNSFERWSEYSLRRFNNLKSNEERINKIFINMYNLKNDLDYFIDEKYVSVFKADYNRDIKSFISYVVGCMFGRYSLDDEGLQFAGGEFNINNYNKFIPDDDNIIPVLDTAYFEDDIVGYFTKFVETCFGEDTLEENLDFIAGALSKSNKSSREIIRDYLLKNFFNDHKKTYKKCPIYWQFSSGKENGFNCLVYMHRYEPGLVARIRTDYLHKTQKAIEQAIANCDNIINHSSSSSEITKATKDKNKLQKQLKETQEYDEALAHIANQNIEIDLDDGVKVNYAKFQNIEVSREGKKAKKINLLKKL